MADSLLTVDEAMPLLTPYLDDLRACFQAGWNTWTALGERVPELRVNLTPRTRANIVYDTIATEATRRFRDQPGVYVSKQRGGFLALAFAGQLVLRFKKFRRGYKTSSIPTRQAQKYACQMELEGLPPQATLAVAGYILNDLQTEFSELAIACTDRNKLEWLIPIDLPGDTPPSIRATEPDDGPRAPRVRRIGEMHAAEEKRTGEAG